MSEHIGWDPARIELLWGLKEPAKRGPRPTLSVEEIVRAGIELADADGLEGLSMQRLAERLGVGTMSLYTYVPDKASLLEVMLDRAVAGIDLTDASDEGWRPTLERAAYAMLDAYHRHPWTLQVFVGGPPVGPNQVAFMESALQLLSGTGLADERLLEILLLLLNYVRGAAHLSVGVIQAERGSGMGADELASRYTEAFRRALDPDRFPLTSRLMTSVVLAAPPTPSPSSPGADVGFRFGLERILDGIEAYVQASADDPAE